MWMSRPRSGPAVPIGPHENQRRAPEQILPMERFVQRFLDEEKMTIEGDLVRKG